VDVVRRWRPIVAGLAAFAATTAAPAVAPASAVGSPAASPAVGHSAGPSIPASADQLIVVSSPTADPAAPGYLATLRTYERAGPGSAWRRVFGAWPAETGSGHLVSAAGRREGDHATPRGVFGIGRTMYGNEPNPGGLHYAYHRLVCGDWWDEDPYSARYNQFVHVPCGVTPGFAPWSEPLWTETVAYPYFGVVRFNMGPVRGGAQAPGSGIFLHSWVGGATQGCIALREWQLLAVLRWLRPSAHPVIEIGTDAQIEPASVRPDAQRTASVRSAGRSEVRGLPRALPASLGYVDVSVATVWTSPSAPRAIDRPALGNPVNMLAWSRVLTTAARLGLDGRIETQALFGEPVRILAQRGPWSRIAVVDQPTPLNRLGYPGWVPTKQLTTNAGFSGLLSGRIAVVRAPSALLRGAGPPLELSFGTRLPVAGRAGSEVQVDTPAGQLGRLASAAVHVYRSVAAIPTPTAAGLVSAATSFLGVRYLWGGTSAYGFDCSGLVNLIYRVNGIVIPRDADAQALAGRPVARDALAPGDLVFFATDPPSRAITHVAMYLGGGQVIESPDSAGAVHITPLGAFGNEYVTARRYIPAG
jgi:cell wall-associated NlpC family hydrolase/L,D-peptidoglycan transpeptidase YkuD (ErfK/YbiS/YcfS/YnhG family)